MPRQKFCSVPGCLSTTELIKREQESFLSAFCDRCRIKRPCRCPAPDIYTTRKETRTKFTSWCSAIGLKDPGYYINVCYKHFSAGCPSRACPNPDVVVPVWEKHVRDKMNNNHRTKSKSNMMDPVASKNTAASKKHHPRPMTSQGKSQLFAKTLGGGTSNSSSVRVRPIVKRAVVIQQRTTAPAAAAGHPHPAAAAPPLIARSSSTGSTSSNCSSSSSSPIASCQPTLPMSVTTQHLIQQQMPDIQAAAAAALRHCGAVVIGQVSQPRHIPPPPDLSDLLSSIAQRHRQQQPPIGAQCFLTLNPHPPPPLPQAALNIVTASPVSHTPLRNTKISFQQPDLRKLNPLPPPSITIKVEPDLKKLTPVPMLRSNGPDASGPPPMVSSIAKSSNLVAAIFSQPSTSLSGTTTFGQDSPSTIPQILGVPSSSHVSTASIDLQDLDYDCHQDVFKSMDIPSTPSVTAVATATVKQEIATPDLDDDEIHVVLLEDSNGMLDQSEDPCLNDGNRTLSVPPSAILNVSGSPFGEESVHKWLEICEA
jgi:hypothetical protein